MNDIELKAVRKNILSWGRKNYQSYPWRGIEDPWLGLLAEVLLQRTRAAHVQKYFEEISTIFPTPESVIDASKAELEQIGERFGLHRRLRTLIELAYYLDGLDHYPFDAERLTSIYGIGHYTAAAYLSMHMHTRAVIVDSNVARWLARLTGKSRPIDPRHCQWLWDLADDLTPRRGFKEYNYAVLDFTMGICKPMNPRCAECPLVDQCDYLQSILSADSLPLSID